MKTGNVILAIFLWLCIPITFFLGAIFGILGGGFEGGVICGIGAPLILFILGLIALITGMEKKSTTQSIKPIVIEKHQYLLEENSEKKELISNKIDEDIEKDNNKKYCFQCGTKLEGTPKFCNKCGTKLR